MKKSKIIVLVGKCASGKSTLMKELSSFKEFNKVVTYTTRPKRVDEVEGDDYLFVSDEMFDNILKDSNTFGATEYNVNGKKFRYTFSKNLIRDDMHNIMVVNPIGLKEMMNDSSLVERLCIIYVQSTLGERIAKYLIRENKTDEAYKNLMARLLQDEKDFADIDTTILNVIPHIDYHNHYNTKETIAMAKNIQMYFGVYEKL